MLQGPVCHPLPAMPLESPQGPQAPAHTLGLIRACGSFAPPISSHWHSLPTFLPPCRTLCWAFAHLPPAAWFRVCHVVTRCSWWEGCRPTEVQGCTAGVPKALPALRSVGSRGPGTPSRARSGSEGGGGWGPTTRGEWEKLAS